MTEFDLGAARRKRAPSEDKALVITGEDGEVIAKYPLTPDLPAEFFDHGTEGKLGLALRSIFLSERDADDFMERFKPSFEDIGEIVGGIYPDGIGGTLGEALASGG